MLAFLLALVGACTERPASCPGSCLTTDTGWYFLSDSSIKAWYGANPYYAQELYPVPSSCLKNYASGNSSSSSGSSSNDSAIIAQMSISATSLFSSPVFWEIFGIGLSAVVLLSIPRWATQSILRILHLSQGPDT